MRIGVCCATLLVLCGGCKTVEAPPPPPPPKVVVERPVQRDVINFDGFTGTLRASQEVEIRARVEGFLDEMRFAPTSKVGRGDVLFVIEQAPYRAAEAQARADVQASEAGVRRAESDLERLELAVRTNAVSQQEVTRARAERDQAKAGLLAAQAAVTQAEIDMDYTTIESPISGVTGRNLVDPGNIVGRGESTLLSRVYAVDPIHVYFEVPERMLVRFLEEIEGFDGRKGEPHPLFVSVDGTDRIFEGAIDYIDPAADAGTGTVEVRGALSNAEQRLLPGLFVRVRVPGKVEEDALLVQETALSADLGGRFLLVVLDDNVVDKRYVELGPLETDGLRVIREGIASGERYISEGLQRARPGMPVNPTDAAPATATAPAEANTDDGTSEG